MIFVLSLQCCIQFHLELDHVLTHWGRDKIAINFLTFSNAFSGMKIYRFQLRFQWSFPRVQLSIFQHWFRTWLGAGQATSHYLNQWCLIYWCIYVSLGLNELKRHPTVYHFQCNSYYRTVYLYLPLDSYWVIAKKVPWFSCFFIIYIYIRKFYMYHVYVIWNLCWKATHQSMG